MQDSLQCESNDRIFTVVKWKKNLCLYIWGLSTTFDKAKMHDLLYFQTDYSMYYIDVCICFSSLS